MKHGVKTNGAETPGYALRPKNWQPGQGNPEEPLREKPPGGIDMERQLLPLCAAVLLGLCELIFIGASANYLTMQSVGVSLMFSAISLLIAVFSIAILAWGTLKRLHGNYADSLEFAKAGVSLGICTSVAVCALAGLFAIAGMGPDRLSQRFSLEKGAWETAGSYLLIFVEINVIYLFVGLCAGALAKLIVKTQGSEAAAQNAGTGGSGKKKGAGGTG